MAAFATEQPTAVLRNPITLERVDARLLGGVRKVNGAEAQGVFSAASKSVEYSDRLRGHYRESRRMSCEIPCNIELVLMDGALYDTGVAVLRNISPSGALVSSFEMSGGNLPTELFKIRLVLKGELYAGIGIEATPIRFAIGTHGIGIKFDEIFVAC